MDQIDLEISQPTSAEKFPLTANERECSHILMEGYAHQKLSHAIIGAAMKVLNTLKPALDQRIYENALVIELQKRGHTLQQQTQFAVFYKGYQVGRLRSHISCYAYIYCQHMRFRICIQE